MTRKSVQGSKNAFGKVYLKAVEEGFLSQMGKSDLKVYIALVAHVRDGKCCVGYLRIAKLTGLATGTVSAATRRLMSTGVVKREWDGNGYKASYYLPSTVQPVSNGHKEPTVQHPPNGRSDSTFQYKPNGVSQEPFSVQTPDRSVSESEPFSPHRTEQRNKLEQKQQPEAASATADLIQALTNAGIGNPPRSELASRNLTPRIVRDVVAACREQGKGPGLIVMELRARADQLDSQQQTRAKRESATDEHRQQRRAEEAATKRDQEELDRWYEALTDEERAALRAQAIKTATGPMKNRLNAPDNHSRWVKHAV